MASGALADLWRQQDTWGTVGSDLFSLILAVGACFVSAAYFACGFSAVACSDLDGRCGGPFRGGVDVNFGRFWLWWIWLRGLIGGSAEACLAR